MIVPHTHVNFVALSLDGDCASKDTRNVLTPPNLTDAVYVRSDFIFTYFSKLIEKLILGGSHD
jgi:hypothetical protein